MLGPTTATNVMGERVGNGFDFGARYTTTVILERVAAEVTYGVSRSFHFNVLVHAAGISMPHTDVDALNAIECTPRDVRGFVYTQRAELRSADLESVTTSTCPDIKGRNLREAMPSFLDYALRQVK